MYHIFHLFKIIGGPLNMRQGKLQACPYCFTLEVLKFFFEFFVDITPRDLKSQTVFDKFNILVCIFAVSRPNS